MNYEQDGMLTILVVELFLFAQIVLCSIEPGRQFVIFATLHSFMTKLSIMSSSSKKGPYYVMLCDFSISGLSLLRLINPTT
jgi:hypothetical protein